VLVAVAGLVVVVIARHGSSSASSSSTDRAATVVHQGQSLSLDAVSHGRPGGVISRGRPHLKEPTDFAVGLTRVTTIDHTRSVTLPDGRTVPRTIVTLVRYPALGPTSAGDLLNAPPAREAGPFPLVVFGHGFAVTPGLYSSLLRAWTRAGYVVAAPVFPLENANAPGGPNESDLPNQPADMSLVITRMRTAEQAAAGPLSGLIATREIAVTGQSDGGDTALAVAYDPRYRDPRVRAAMILSGAEIPGIAAFRIAPGGPPLLAVQGTADTVNPPSATDAFYDSAPAPKYRLNLFGAAHLPPYTSAHPQLNIVEKTTIAFLDLYLKHVTNAQARLRRVGAVPGIATLEADP
jgi:dienelactone hydrolase